MSNLSNGNDFKSFLMDEKLSVPLAKRNEVGGIASDIVFNANGNCDQWPRSLQRRKFHKREKTNEVTSEKPCLDGATQLGF